MGSWKIMAILLPRRALTRRRLAREMSSPNTARRVVLRRAARGSRPMTASEVIDLPHPDSPTRQRVSPRRTWNEISRTACKAPRGVSMSTRRFCTSNTRSESLMVSGLVLGREPLVQAVAGQVDGENQQRQGTAGDGDQPERKEHIGF